MPKSTKKGTTIALGSTLSERDEMLRSLREVARKAGFFGRNKEGNLSGLLGAIASLPEEERGAIAIVLKKFFDKSK